MIQENQVITVFLYQIQALYAAFRIRYLNLGLFQKVPQHFAVDGIIVYNQ